MSMSRWRALAGTGSGLALLVLICSFVAMAGPRASAQLQTTAVRQLVAQTPAMSKVIVATGSYNEVQQGPGNLPLSSLDKVRFQLRERLSGMQLASPKADWQTVTTSFFGITDRAPTLKDFGRQLELVYSTGLNSRARLTKGAWPTKIAGRKAVQIAVSTATAYRFGLAVGSHVRMAGITLRVSGIFQPLGAGTPFWRLDPVASVPNFVIPARGRNFWQGGAFVGASGLQTVETALIMDNTQIHWVLPMQLSRLTDVQARTLAVSLPAAINQDGNGIRGNPAFPPFSIALFSGLGTVLTNFLTQADSVNSLLSLLSVSLTAIGAAVLLLAVWLLTERRHAEFVMLQARGASRRQLALLALRGCVLPAVAGAAIGVAAAIVATPGAGEPLGWWLSGVTLLVVLAGIPGLTIRRHRAGRVASRWGRPAVRRLVVEAAVVAASIGGIITLRDQGLTSGSIDPYTSLAPVLVAVPVAVVVLRCYPLLARPLLRVAGRGKGATAFIGLARATRSAATAALPVFAMVLALTLVAFGGMFRSAVQRGDELASWEAVGADAVVTARGALSPALQKAISTVPGVVVAAPVSLTTAVFPSGFGQFGVVLVDRGAYASLIDHGPGTGPLLTGPGIPALATNTLASKLHNAQVSFYVNGSQQVRVRLAGIIPAATPIASAVSNQYVVVPATALGHAAPPPTMMLVDGGNRQALLAAARKHGATVSLRGPVLSALQDAPLQHDAYVAFAIGGGVAAALSMLVLLLTLVIGARSRELTLARMSTMGMSGDQGRSLVIVEALPQVVAALVGGVACAALLGPLLGPELSLTVFTGSTTGVPVRIDPIWLGGAGVGLVVLAMLTLGAQTKIASRGIVNALRMGE